MSSAFHHPIYMIQLSKNLQTKVAVKIKSIYISASLSGMIKYESTAVRM